MSYAVGIDLGTVNCRVAVYRNGKAETIPIDGQPTMPSVVSFCDDGRVLVGKPAKARLVVDPINTVASVKRFMGNRTKIYSIRSWAITPVNITSIILRRLVEGASEYLGQKIKNAVVTVPAYFTEAQREDTQRAGEEVGLNKPRLIPEPTAAALAYGLDQGRDQTIMVYDLGGGTFDVSILRVGHNHFEVKAVGGNNRLGGNDFDLELLRWAGAQFLSAHGLDVLDWNNHATVVARQRLKEAVETAKITLSQNDQANIIVADCMGHPLALKIGQADYRALITPLLQQTVASIRLVLQDAGLTATDIDSVILVGGSTKNHAVHELISQEFHRPIVAEQAEGAVAHGAAIMAANLFQLNASDTVPVEVTNVTGHSLGVDMLSDRKQLIFQPLVPRQTRYPCKRGHLGFTHRPLQKKVVMTVYRGEHRDPGENTYLGRLTLPVAPPQSENVPIGVIFELDTDGIIHFTAIQLPTNLKSRSIVQYANEHNGALDLAAVETLLKSGDARAKTILIKNE